MADRAVIVVESGTLLGAPSATSDTDPIDLAGGNAVSAEIVLLSLSGTMLTVSWIGSNFLDGNYVATGPSSLVLTRSPDIRFYQIGVTPWAYVKLRFVASDASVVYSAKIRHYSI